MKSKVMVALMLLGVLFSAVACSNVKGASDITDPDKYLVNISAEDFSREANVVKEVEVKVGETFKIALDSNATTGFQWTAQANIADLNVLSQVTHEYIAPNTTVIGQGGIEEWTFKAGKVGTASVTLSYDRPWEGGEKGVRTFELNVTVK